MIWINHADDFIIVPDRSIFTEEINGWMYWNLKSKEHLLHSVRRYKKHYLCFFTIGWCSVILIFTCPIAVWCTMLGQKLSKFDRRHSFFKNFFPSHPSRNLFIDLNHEYPWKVVLQLGLISYKSTAAADNKGDVTEVSPPKWLSSIPLQLSMDGRWSISAFSCLINWTSKLRAHRHVFHVYWYVEYNIVARMAVVWILL